MADARIVVIVPALNEAGSITALMERVPFGPRSVIVADNGSTDGTADLARQAGARVAHAPRRGYGQACLAGLAADPDADIVVFIDADLSEDPEEMPRLVNPILNNDADLVLGTRRGRSRPWHARIGTTMCVALINRLMGNPLRGSRSVPRSPRLGTPERMEIDLVRLTAASGSSATE